MKTVILGSGQGTNAQAIVQAKTSQLLGNAEIVAILSDKRESGILEIAQSHNIENRYGPRPIQLGSIMQRKLGSKP